MINLQKQKYVPSLRYNYWASQCKEKGFNLQDMDDYADLGKHIFIEGDMCVYSVHDSAVYAQLGDVSYFLYHIN
jgi:hypothetical protein